MATKATKKKNNKVTKRGVSAPMLPKKGPKRVSKEVGRKRAPPNSPAQTSILENLGSEQNSPAATSETMDDRDADEGEEEEYAFSDGDEEEESEGESPVARAVHHDGLHARRRNEAPVARAVHHDGLPAAGRRNEVPVARAVHHDGLPAGRRGIPNQRRHHDGDGVLLDNSMLIGAKTSRAKAKAERKPHVVQRVSAFVKRHVFKKIKFIINDVVLERVMARLEKEENFSGDARQQVVFRRMYRTAAMDALNAKRSSCEQMGAKICHKYLKELVQEKGVSVLDQNACRLFKMEDLLKMRMSETAEECNAFLWFYGEFLEAVAGRLTWGKQKYHQTVSEAKDFSDARQSIVSITDEAFALLMIENYRNKWESHFRCSETGMAKVKVEAKYTSSRLGTTEYGGWSWEGFQRFNQLVKLVEDNRLAAQSNAKELELLLYLQSTPAGEKLFGRKHVAGEGDVLNGATTTAMAMVEPWCEELI